MRAGPSAPRHPWPRGALPKRPRDPPGFTLDGPKARPSSPQDGPRRRQDAPRRHQEAPRPPKTSPRGPKTPLRASQEAPRPAQETSGTPRGASKCSETIELINFCLSSVCGSRGQQDGPKTLPKRPQMPSEWSKPCPAARKTAHTSILNPPGLDFKPSRPRFPTLQTSILILS